MHTAILYILSLAAVATAHSGPDTLVVCPVEFRPAIVEWENYRRAEGHQILVIEPAKTAESLKAAIARADAGGNLKYLLLIGDVADPRTFTRTPLASRPPLVAPALRTVPTNYEIAKINKRWGSEPQIATDFPYSDTDGDGEPNLAIGRIPADSAAELSAVMRKTLRYEQDSKPGPWTYQLNFIAGTGGFGALADAVIEAAGRQVILQSVPADYKIEHTATSLATTSKLPPGEFAASIRRQLDEDCLLWVYMGHGMPCELAGIMTPSGEEPLFDVNDVPTVNCGSRGPLAVLIACYTGALDASRDCLAEELLIAEKGPVTVIAATRVTMPYGNTVLGHELLHACFVDQTPAMGDVMKAAQLAMLHAAGEDKMRIHLDAMADGLSPPPVDLSAERREHVLMYHLFGDPLLRLHRPEAKAVATLKSEAINKATK